MTFQIAYWDDELQQQMTRDSTPEEDAQRDADIAAAAKVAVPEEITRRQALQALAIKGLLDKVQPLIDAIADPLQRQLAQIEYDTSQVFKRHRPLVVQLLPGLGLSESDGDDLFIFAASLT
jgi:HEAT repeat protein